MVMITGWTEYGGANKQAHVLEFEICAWTAPNDVGKTHTENFFHTDRTGKGHPQKRFTCLAMAAGLFTAKDVKQWKAVGATPEIDMSKLVGRPIMIELVEQPDATDANKKYLNIGGYGLAMYHIKDDRVKEWPKRQSVFNQCAAMVGDWVSDKPTAPPAAKKPSGEADPFAAMT